MKHLFLSLMILSSFNLSAQSNETEKTKIPEGAKIGAPSNPVSQGADESASISDSPIGTTERQAEEYERRPSSMGGAPNVGGGMGTGTGAGSSVGRDVEGNINAGAVSGEENE